MKRLSTLFIILSLVLSHLMCAVVAFNYASILCGIMHAGYSAPAELAFLYAIPFAIGAVICLLIAKKLRKS